MPAPKKTATKAPEPKSTSLTQLRNQLTKRWGESRVILKEEVRPYDVISTGSYGLDVAMHVGGWPRGRISELVGQEGTGKTTLSITSMANAQRETGLAVAYIDMEQTFDESWAINNGLDLSDKRFLRLRPDDSEDVADMAKKLLETDLFSMVVVDSIGGMESRKAFDKDAEDVTVGKNAQVITRMVKQLAVLAARKNVAVLLINQFRANVGQPMGFDISAGPKALKYATSVKVETSRTGNPPLKVKMGSIEEIVGLSFRAKVTRSKVAPQGRTAEFYIKNQTSRQYGEIGIYAADEAFSLGRQFGVFEQSGAWYVLPDGSRHQGQPQVVEHLTMNPAVAIQVRNEALAKVADEIIPNAEVVVEKAIDIEESA